MWYSDKLFIAQNVYVDRLKKTICKIGVFHFVLFLFCPFRVIFRSIYPKSWILPNIKKIRGLLYSMYYLLKAGNLLRLTAYMPLKRVLPKISHFILIHCLVNLSNNYHNWKYGSLCIHRLTAHITDYEIRCCLNLGLDSGLFLVNLSTNLDFLPKIKVWYLSSNAHGPLDRYLTGPL